ncbi:MAG: hypothetical protein N2380_03730 [bacterium]|nr:hypothetical protein [bacterium]
MIKKLIVFLVALLFVVGAAGGCLNDTPPNLNGTWKGKLSRNINPTIPNFADVTINLTQDQNNQFSGNIEVKYNPNTPNEVVLIANIYSNDSSTNTWNATIKANGVNSTGGNITISYGNVNLTIPNGETFTFTFTLLHFYACRGGSLTELTGGYTLTVGNDINPIDSGAVDLVKQ